MEYPFKDLMPLDEATARTGYYKDWTHIDADTFHQISELVKFIREKGYGADTREAIAQALERVYHDAIESGHVDMEISKARKNFKDLAARLDASDQKLNSNTAQLAQTNILSAEAVAKADAMASGSPRGVYATLELLQAAYPTGATGAYLVTADGKWYYWSGSAWTIGGVYQATSISDDSVTPLKINKNDYLTETLVDIINRSTVTNGKYISPTGTEVTLKNWSHSDFIPVVAGETYSMFLKDSLGGTVFQLEATYYNSAKVVIGHIESQIMPLQWTAPENTAFIIVNFGTAYSNDVYLKETQLLPTQYDVNWLNVKLDNLDNEVTQHIENTVASVVNDEITNIGITNRWFGKKANFLGDSITQGAFLENPTTERFSALVKSGLGLSVENNYGQSGTRLANNITTSGTSDTSAMCMRYTSMSNDADLIFVLGGTNDYGSATTNGLKTAPFGVSTDRTNDTFYGALHVLYKGLIEKYVGKTIVIITPLHRTGIGESSIDDLKLNPDTSKNLKDYVNAIREVAEYYGLYVLDLYKELNINPIIPVNKTTYMPDGLHPNKAGHQLVANAIINYVKKL